MVRTQAANMGSSPQSSTENTHYGTPSTNITAMSPEAATPDTRTQNAPRFALRVNTTAAQQSNALTSSVRLALPATGSAQLSPTADIFTPRAVTFNLGSHVVHIHEQAAEGTNVSPVRTLMASSMPEALAGQYGTPHGAVGQATAHSMNNDVAQRRLTAGMHVAWESFSTDQNVARTFQISDKHMPSLFHIIGHFPAQFKSLACIDSKNIESGIVRLTFRDDRDAKQAYVLAASLTHPHCQIMQLSAKDLAIARGNDPNLVSNYEGQLIVSLIGRSAHAQKPTLVALFNKLAAFGHVKAIHTVPSTTSGSISLRVEFHDTADADSVLDGLNGSSIEETILVVTRYEPDLIMQPSPSAQGLSNASASRPSLTGRSTVPPGDLARMENVMARIMRESGSPGFLARSSHNHVDIERIQAGIDVRTTIMLRNIPNKVDQATLKALLDQTSFGAYDFMYLRIDFANNCNVGYAFINFVDPLAIVPFARSRAGQRWNIFSSDKVAEISYATIQGRDCLVQKFRNSSVMLEHPSYRPKLYFTRPSPHVGQEESFPEPDNYSKMRRSIDNAEHIGLFQSSRRPGRQQASPQQPVQRSSYRRTRRARSARLSVDSIDTTGAEIATPPSSAGSTGLFAPREGQAHREEQRRRRSQFDRGTPGAEFEAFSYGLTDPALSPAPAQGLSARLLNAFDGLTL